MKSLLNYVAELDFSVKTIMKKGIYFSIVICLFSAILLFTYEISYSSPSLYYIGLSIFKLGITYIAAFFSCGFAFNEIKKEWNG